MADITAEVEDMKQLLHNLGSHCQELSRPTWPTTQATVLLILTQAFLKLMVEAHGRTPTENKR